LFKPVIETKKTVAKDVAKEITEPVMSALRTITEGVQKATELAKYPSIQAAKTDEDLDTSMVIPGAVVEMYLRQFASKNCMTDTVSFSSTTVPSR